MAKQDLKKIFFNGIITENPTFRLVLGMCPTLAVTTSVLNGLGMGLATAFVLVCSNLVISLLRNFIPSKVRIPAFIVVIASFVTIVQLVLNAFLPDLASSLGLFIPLIVVNCIIFARAEAFASKNGPLASMTDGLGMGLGFTVSLTLISVIGILPTFCLSQYIRRVTATPSLTCTRRRFSSSTSFLMDFM